MEQILSQREDLVAMLNLRGPNLDLSPTTVLGEATFLRTLDETPERSDSRRSLEPPAYEPTGWTRTIAPH